MGLGYLYYPKYCWDLLFLTLREWPRHTAPYLCQAAYPQGEQDPVNLGLTAHSLSIPMDRRSLASTHVIGCVGLSRGHDVAYSSSIVTTSRYVVPTGRVKVPAGRYVVPTGKDDVIVSAGRTKVIPAGSTILVL
ncbi:hypothetical protein Tco_0106763, partial [Tanacetum coccineum]